MNKLGVAVSAVALVTGATFVQAQTTFEQMVDLFEAGAAAEGVEITFSDRIVGGDGSVEYRDFSLTDPDEGFTLVTDWIKGTPNADDPNTVTFTVAESISISGNSEGEPFDLNITSDDLMISTNAMLAQMNDITDINAAFSADSISFEGGDPTSLVMRDLMVSLENLDFAVLVSMLDMTVDGSLTMGKSVMDYDLSMDGQEQIVNQTVDSMEMTFTFDIPQGEEDLISFMDGTKNGELIFKSGASVFDSSIAQDGMQFQYSGTAGAGEGVFSMVGGLLTYAVSGGAVDLTVVPGEGIPMPPVDVSLTEMVLRVLVPFNSADEAEQAVVKLLLTDLEVGEGLWSMIDPGQTIPRDPANLDIDLDAMVQIDAMAAMMTGMDNPFETAKVDVVNVNKILLAIGGALIEADGAIEVDNSGPFPLPNGAIDVVVEGLQGLSEKLVALGLVDQMQAGMMMGMIMAFSTPDGSDRFTSEITFDETGIFANGQPLQ